MDVAAQRALARLRDSEGLLLKELARMVVDDATATPVRELAAPRWIASQILTGLEAATRGEHLREWVEERVKEGRERWKDEERPLRTWFPPEAEEPLRKLLARPWSPDEELTLQLIDQPAVRGLVREVLETSLTRFGHRVRRLDQSVLGGAAGKTARRAVRGGRGFLGNLASGLGAATEGIVGAVAEEVEAQVERRVKEHVATATSEALRQIAEHLCDPAHAEAYSGLRLSVLDFSLDMPISELFAEVDKLQPEEVIEVISGAIQALITSEDFLERTAERIQLVIDRAGDGTLGAWLDEVGLRDAWTDSTSDLVATRLMAVVQTDAFEVWWAGLFDEEA